MKKEGQLIALMGTYSMILLVVCILGILILSQKKENAEPTLILETAVETEEIYIFVDADNSATQADNPGEVLFIAKEYEEKIGIFDTSGHLIKTIDIYTKTCII